MLFLFNATETDKHSRAVGMKDTSLHFPYDKNIPRIEVMTPGDFHIVVIVKEKAKKGNGIRLQLPHIRPDFSCINGSPLAGHIHDDRMLEIDTSPKWSPTGG